MDELWVNPKNSHYESNIRNYPERKGQTLTQKQMLIPGLQLSPHFKYLFGNACAKTLGGFFGE